MSANKKAEIHNKRNTIKGIVGIDLKTTTTIQKHLRCT